MARRWRTWRVLLAVLLLGIAALTFWVWPPSPRWTISGQFLRGFDERRQLVYLQQSVDVDPKAVVLNVYDLTNGDFVARTNCRPRVVGRDIVMPRGGDLLALVSYELSAFELFALPGGEWLSGIRMTGDEKLQAAAFSADSRFLAACTNAGYQVWDV